MSGVEGNSRTQKAVATQRGWENPVTGEVLVAIRGLATKAGAGDPFTISWGVSPVGGGIARVYVDFNEKVDVTSGATLTVYSKLKAHTTLRGSVTGSIVHADAITLGTGADAKTYTFVASPTTANQVKIGATALDTFTSLKAAVNLTDVAGVDYAASTTVHATIAAVSVTQPSITAFIRFEAKNGGSNTSASTEAITDASFGFSATQTILGSITTFILKFGSHSLTQGLSRVIFDKLTDGSTTATWPAQGQTVSVTTGVITGTIVDTSTTTASVTTISSTVVAGSTGTETPYIA